MSRAAASRGGSWAGAIAFVTGNPGKLAEARRIWGSGGGGAAGPRLEAVELELAEIQSLDLLEVLRAKGEEAWRRLRRPLVVEETGFEIDAFGGFPGPLVKWMLQALGPEGMARAALAVAEREGRTGAAVARCMTLLRDGERELVGEGVERGTLVLPPRGDQGFGWDPVFLPEGESRTYGELPAEGKDRIGHRGKAWRDLKRQLG
ncbi:MAG TPA: non-canonical purine NTP pyrophosphatase [Thermoanaerobaculia bacterium]|nr:non-canonical purine NTP pyrophosphatase [Thermoanaerobaculia bacterium]